MEGIWIPPSTDFLKFNVDGSTRDSPGNAGVGGVLRDANGMVLCIFSCFVGIQNSNNAKILDILKAINLCASSQYTSGREIIIASDSKVAVSWVYNDGFGSLDNIDSIYDIREKLRYLRKVIVTYNPTSTNSMVDMLAKRASNLEGDIVEWSS
ncbi:hypothetical protein Dsin_020840 [Dipteronia sinensis]|uniref:RNase H type-1 domain-containing protein n=1 Tax=Dipteronia sinensis TaxID=43782 RepID=A0AAE0AAS5_9ROSI|nr:hypothetical protein Dsin_020831 [Dipteronia sinensis]KAK3206794.1 hypothetical protein Dsin_020840 [Dipteronia sinensis]